MTKETLFFLLSVSTVTLGLSFFTAFIYTKAFGMGDKLAYFIKLAGVIFPFLYILANALSRSSNLEFVKYIYTLMSIGAGIAFYFLLGAIFLAFVLVFIKIFGGSMPKLVPWLTVLLALSMSFMGFVQARFIKTVQYEIAIENLPPGWQGKKAVVLSDTHYGLVNHKKAAKRVVDLILNANPDIVFVSGDFFDGPSIETSFLVREWKRVSDSVPVFFVPGNHEEYGDYSKFILAVKDMEFIVLEDSITMYDGVQIAGMTYRMRGKEVEVKEVFDQMGINPENPLIVLNHAPTYLEEIKNAGGDIVFSGHTHRGQFWPIRYVTRAIYGKYHYGLNFYENLQVLTTSGVGTSGPPIRFLNTPEIIKIRFSTVN